MTGGNWQRQQQRGLELKVALATATGNGSAAQPGGTRRTSGKMERQTHWRHRRTDGRTDSWTTFTVSIARGLVGSLGAGLHVKHIHHECQSDRWQMRLQLVCCPISAPSFPSLPSPSSITLPASQSVVCLGLMSYARAKGQMKIFQLLQTPPAHGRNVNLTL